MWHVCENMIMIIAGLGIKMSCGIEVFVEV